MNVINMLDAKPRWIDRATAAEAELAAVVGFICADGNGIYAKQVTDLLARMRADKRPIFPAHPSSAEARVKELESFNDRHE